MSVILKPIITEKMSQVAEKLNRYGFLVDKKANKLEIKKAIKDIYGVEVDSVNTMMYAGKRKTRYNKKSKCNRFCRYCKKC